MGIIRAFRSLTKFEWILWICSVLTVALTSFSGGNFKLISACASWLGVTAILFIAKGNWIGQAMMIIFAILYGVISYDQRYYGEMITYLCMSLPMAVINMINWIKHPFDRAKNEVKVGKMSTAKWLVIMVSALGVTVIFYFILKVLGNANLFVSTISVTTSFLAATLSFLRSPYFALGYVTNDFVLIVLWTMSTISDFSYFPMVVCFIMFFVLDSYSFISWRKMEKRQSNI